MSKQQEGFDAAKKEHGGMFEPGILVMEGAIKAAEQTPQARQRAALTAFATNCMALADLPVDQAIPHARGALQHTINHFDSIEAAVREGFPMS